MKHLKILFILFALISASVVKAQFIGIHGMYGIPKMYSTVEKATIKILSGDVSGLKDVKQINIVYDYSTMQVGGFGTEAEYIFKKTEEYKHDDPEEAARFKQDWTNAKFEIYEPKFELLFNKIGNKRNIYGANYSAKGNVTLKVETFNIDPGLNDERSKNPAYLDVRCTFYDSDDKVIVQYFIRHSGGVKAANYRYDAGPRIGESYARAAKMLMTDITKKLKLLNT